MFLASNFFQTQRVTHGGWCGYRCVATHFGCAVENVIEMLVEIMLLPTTSEIARQQIGDLKAHMIERNGSLIGHIDTENSSLDSRFYLTDEMIQALADYKQIMFVIMKPPNKKGNSEILTLLGDSESAFFLEYSGPNKFDLL